MSHGITHNDSMFSVRAMPWHGLGVVLEEYPRSIDEALDKAGLGWKVTHGDVLIVKTPARTDDFGTKHPPELIPANGFKANLREDTGDVLGIVSDEYEVVDNRDAFRFLDALIGSDLHFETAGSLWGGRRVWCLARLHEHVELGGDPSATYIYVANSHDGSMAVTVSGPPPPWSTRTGRPVPVSSTTSTAWDPDDMGYLSLLVQGSRGKRVIRGCQG